MTVKRIDLPRKPGMLVAFEGGYGESAQIWFTTTTRDCEAENGALV